MVVGFQNFVHYCIILVVLLTLLDIIRYLVHLFSRSVEENKIF